MIDPRKDTMKTREKTEPAVAQRRRDKGRAFGSLTVAIGGESHRRRARAHGGATGSDCAFAAHRRSGRSR